MTEKLSAFTIVHPSTTDFVAGASAGSPNTKFKVTDLGFLPAMGVVDIYVDLAGSDATGDGSVGNPFLTIQHALTVASYYDFQGNSSFFPVIHINGTGGVVYDCTGSGVAPAGLAMTALRNCPAGGIMRSTTGTASDVVIKFHQTCLSLSYPGTQWTLQNLSWDSGAFTNPTLFAVGNSSRLVLQFTHNWQDSSATGAAIMLSSATSGDLTSNCVWNFASPFTGFAVGGEFGSIFVVGGGFNLAAGSYGNLWLDFQDGNMFFSHLITAGHYTNAASFTGNKTLISGAPSVIQTVDGTTDVFPGTNFGGSGIDGQCQVVNQAAFGGWNLPLFDNQITLGSNCAKNTLSYAKDTLNGQCYLWANDGGTQLRIKQIGRVPNVQTGATYTIAKFDSDGRIEMSSATANTVTVPVNASVSLAIGTEIKVTQTGAGSTTIAAASGLTAHNFGALSGQWASALLYKRAADEWVQTTC